MNGETESEQVDQPQYGQLIQIQVPLDQASDAFIARDETGRIPIILIPKQLNRVRNELVVAGVVLLIAAWVVGSLLDNPSLFWLSVPVSLILIILGVYRSFIVRIPEGVNGLLARGGRYYKSIGSGTHIIPPWILVSHLVTRREIPYDVPVVEALTQDNVRATMDTLVTFTISDPYRFVYSISADDFDQVFQATCQDELRSMMRQVNSEEVIARVQRQREELQLLIQQAETRRQVVELEAEAEALRLARMEERLRAYPLAAQYDWESSQLEVARALAGNTRAVVQIGDASNISRAFVLGDLMRFPPPEVDAAPKAIGSEVTQPPVRRGDGH